MSNFNIDSIRSEFPSLKRQINGHPVVYLDGPGGTQVPQNVIDAISGYYKNSNANIHGFFASSMETDDVIHTARTRMADFLGADGPETISFSQNMTTMTYSLSKGIARLCEPGDEILITQLDHEANRGPWLDIQEYGIIVKEVILLNNGRLDYQDLANKVTSKTKLLAIGAASNAIGTVNDLKMARKITKEAGALMYVDAVHLAPHFSIDVKEIGCDFLACSAYKFYGPHVGILYSKPGLLDDVPVDRLSVQEQESPFLIETGTLNHAALAGVSASVDFIASLGEGTSEREKLVSALHNIHEYEFELAQRLFNGLLEIDGLSIIGTPLSNFGRTPTMSFTFEDKTPEEICKHLGVDGICAWDGHFYALRAIEILGLLEFGGVTRLGISVYTNEEDISRVLDSLKRIK